MKKYWILLLLIPFLSILSCMDDTSAYLPQDKENVNVDNGINVDTTNKDEVLPEGELVPGMHLVRMKVFQEGDSVERRFKYYMPVTINPAKPISLIFEFHGSYKFEAGEDPYDPMADVSEGNFLTQLAIQNNCIICYPAAETVYTSIADSSGTVNWLRSEVHLPFVDAMLKYFTEDNEPRVDPTRIYSTGHSSGAIFSFVLAFYRSDKFAAITPRAGQMSIKSETVLPDRAVPVRVFAGETDENVYHSAVLENMTDWAERIGGYFASDMQMDSKVYEDYADVTIRSWHGGKADYEIYSLAGIGHGIAATKCLDDMWEFMENHTLDNTSENLFITTNIKDINARCGESFEIKINYTEGATLELPDFPKGWIVKGENTSFTITAPKDYYGAIGREGTLTFTITKGEQTATCDINYLLQVPKTYFELGDIYYNDNFEAVGVVCWVNPDNIKEAKIINLEELPGTYGTGKIGDFKDAIADSFDDGEANSNICVQYNQAHNLGLTSGNSNIIWAAEYVYKNVSGWYLPAVNEWKAIYNNRTVINKTMEEIEGQSVRTQGYYDASTITAEGEKRYYYCINFKTGKEEGSLNQYFDYARAIKKVAIK